MKKSLIKEIPSQYINNANKKKKINTGLLVASIIFGIYAISLLIPLLWGLMMSLQTRAQYITDKLRFPIPPQFKNYAQAFVELQGSGKGLVQMIFNKYKTL